MSRPPSSGPRWPFRLLAGAGIASGALLLAWPSPAPPTPEGVRGDTSGWGTRSGRLVSAVEELFGQAWSDVSERFHSWTGGSPQERPLSKAIALRGRFLDEATNLPIPGVAVAAHRGVDNWEIAKMGLRWGPKEVAHSDVSGRFEFKVDWSPGWTVDLYASAFGWSSAQGRFGRLKEGDIVEIGDHHLRRSPWIHKVRVVDQDRTPLRDFTFEAIRRPERFERATRITKERKFHGGIVRTDHDGYVEVAAAACDWYPRSCDEVDPVQWLDRSPADGIVRARRVTEFIEGVVHDQLGNPVSGSVLLLVEEGSRNSIRGRLDRVESDEQGRFRFVRRLGSTSGPFEIYAGCPDRWTKGVYHGPVSFGDEGLVIDLADRVHLRPSGPDTRTTRSVPVTASHIGLVRALFRTDGTLGILLHDAGRADLLLGHGTVAGDGRGEVTVFGGDVAQARLSVSDSDSFRSVDLGLLTFGDPNELSIDFSRLELGSLIVRFSLVGATSLDDHGSQRASLVRLPGRDLTRTSSLSDHEARFEHVPAGEYELYLDGVRVGEPIRVDAGERLTVSLQEAPPFAPWSLRLLWPDGSPAAGLHLSIAFGSGSWFVEPRTDEGGVVTVPLAPGGPVRVQAPFPSPQDPVRLDLLFPVHQATHPTSVTHTLSFGPGD